MPLEGQCSCGGVKVTLADEGLPIQPMACHCYNCRTTAGSAYSLVHRVPMKDVKFEGDTLKSFKNTNTTSGKPTHRYFCSGCGTPVHTFAEAAPDVTFLKLGLFAGRTPIDRPVVEVFFKNHEKWEEPIPDAQVFDSMP